MASLSGSAGKPSMVIVDDFEDKRTVRPRAWKANIDKDKVIRLRAQGLSLPVLAERFGLHKKTIAKILAKESATKSEKNLQRGQTFFCSR